MDSTGVDPEKIYNDVRQLIFSDCKDTTAWDHLGNVEPVAKPTSKKVHIDETRTVSARDIIQFVDLPPALGLLYAAATATDFRATHLIYLLDVATLPPPGEDPCHRLYDAAIEKQKKLDEIREQRQKERLEAEIADCTFKPLTMSDHQGRGGIDKFYTSLTEWKKHRDKKLAQKAKKDEEDFLREAMVPWQMNERSKHILEKAGGVKSIVERSSPRRTGYDAADVPYNFTPITNSSSKGIVEFSMNRSGSSPQAAQSSPTAIVDRLTQDAIERSKRKEERASLFLLRQKEKLYDKDTGQPLFLPNAMATVVKNGKRVRFDTLTKEERELFMKKIRSRHVDFVPNLILKHQKIEHSDPTSVIRRLAEKQKQRTKNIEKIRKRDEKELETFFHPTIEVKSVEIASSMSDHRKPLFPPKQRPRQLSRSVPRDDVIQSVQFRTTEWARKKEKERQQRKDNANAAEVEECTFKPQVNVVSELLVAQSEAAMLDEGLELYEEQAPVHAASFQCHSSAAPKAPLADTSYVVSGASRRPREARENWSDRQSTEDREIPRTLSFATPAKDAEYAAPSFSSTPNIADRTKKVVNAAQDVAYLENLLASWQALEKMSICGRYLAVSVVLFADAWLPTQKKKKILFSFHLSLYFFFLGACKRTLTTSNKKLYDFSIFLGIFFCWNTQFSNVFLPTKEVRRFAVRGRVAGLVLSSLVLCITGNREKSVGTQKEEITQI